MNKFRAFGVTGYAGAKPRFITKMTAILAPLQVGRIL